MKKPKKKKNYLIHFVRIQGHSIIIIIILYFILFFIFVSFIYLYPILVTSKISAPNLTSVDCNVLYFVRNFISNLEITRVVLNSFTFNSSVYRKTFFFLTIPILNFKFIMLLEWTMYFKWNFLTYAVFFSISVKFF